MAHDYSKISETSMNLILKFYFDILPTFGLYKASTVTWSINSIRFFKETLSSCWKMHYKKIVYDSISYFQSSCNIPMCKISIKATLAKIQTKKKATKQISSSRIK